MTVAGVIGLSLWYHTVPTLLVLLGLIASIMLHEAGHFFIARTVRIRATKFFIGFGPTIWSFHRGEVEYGIKLLPLGGFVSISGMNSKEVVEPEHESRTFRQASYPRRVLVLLAGPAMNFFIGLGEELASEPGTLEPTTCAAVS